MKKGTNTIMTPKKQREFLERYEQNFNAFLTCGAMGINYDTFHKFKQRTPKFQTQMEKLKADTISKLTAKALQLALDGNVHLITRFLDSRINKDSDLGLDTPKQEHEVQLIINKDDIILG